MTNSAWLISQSRATMRDTFYFFCECWWHWGGCPSNCSTCAHLCMWVWPELTLCTALDNVNKTIYFHLLSTGSCCHSITGLYVFKETLAKKDAAQPPVCLIMTACTVQYFHTLLVCKWWKLGHCPLDKPGQRFCRKREKELKRLLAHTCVSIISRTKSNLQHNVCLLFPSVSFSCSVFFLIESPFSPSPPSRARSTCQYSSAWDPAHW